MITDRYEVDPSYFADKYGMPVGERRNPVALPPAIDNEEESDDKTGKKEKNFFD